MTLIFGMAERRDLITKITWKFRVARGNLLWSMVILFLLNYGKSNKVFYSRSIGLSTQKGYASEQSLSGYLIEPNQFLNSPIHKHIFSLQHLSNTLHTLNNFSIKSIFEREMTVFPLIRKQLSITQRKNVFFCKQNIK